MCSVHFQKNLGRKLRQEKKLHSRKNTLTYKKFEGTLIIIENINFDEWFYYLTNNSSFWTKIQTWAAKFNFPLCIDDKCNCFGNTLTNKILPYRTKIYLIVKKMYLIVQKCTLTYKTIHTRGYVLVLEGFYYSITSNAYFCAKKK